MTELKAAAERLRRFYSKESLFSIYPMSEYPSYSEREKAAMEALNEDAFTLADAYLAERPADGEEPLTGEWIVATIPFRGRGGGVNSGSLLVDIKTDGVFRGELHFGWDSGSFWVNLFGTYLGNIKTRQDVRDLCRVLGVALKEGA